MKLRITASLIAFLVMIGSGFFVYSWTVAPVAATLTISGAWASSSKGTEAQSFEHTGIEMPDAETPESDSTSHVDLGTSAIYLTIQNTGRESDRLVSAETPVARTVQIHKTQTKNGTTVMLSTKSVDIPGRRQVEFKPGGLHFMLVDLKQSLQPGDQIQLTLEFEKSGKMAIDVEVRSP